MKPATVTAAYAVNYAKLAEVARSLGYCLALHGTMARDCDLLAVPWTDAAVSEFALVKALREAAGGCWWGPEIDQFYPNGNANRKPHGRTAWSIHLTDRGSEGPYFDVSVMPRQDARTFEGGDGI